MIKKIYNLSIFLIFLIFTVIYLRYINYGLPFFLNNDEGSFLKSTIYFFYFFSEKYKYLSDPFFAPFFNFVIVSILALVYGFLNFDVFEITKQIYFDPSLLIIFGRLASLLICVTGVFFSYLILKKLKISKILIINLLVSLCFSFFFLDIAIVNGKNSYYFLFFLIQYYLFSKFFLKIEKFNKKSYILFGLIGACAWGVNYFCSIVSIYSILILHFKKFGKNKIHYLIRFIFIFLIFGVFLSFFFTETSILYFFLDTQNVNNLGFDISERGAKIIDSLFRSYKIIFFTERYSFLILFLLIPFYLYNSKLRKKYFFIFSFILLFEPILILIFSSAGAFPQLKYFSASIVLAYILIGIIINELLNLYNRKNIYVIFTILNFVFLFNKASVHYEITKILNNKYNFYKILEDKDFQKNLNETIIFDPHILIRKNLKNLNLYKEFHEKKLISTKWYQKDTMKSIESKIKNFDKSFFKQEKMINKIIVFEKSLVIKDFEKFFIFLNEEKGFKYILLPNYDKFNRTELDLKQIEYVRSNFTKVKLYEGSDLITARDLIEKVYLGKKSDLINVQSIGSTYEIYQIR